MQVLLLITLLVASFNTPGVSALGTLCNYTYNQIFTWTNDKIYDSPFPPYLVGNWNDLVEKGEMTFQEIEALRVEALQYYQVLFGLPAATAQFDPVTNNTHVPNWGYLTSVLFDDCYQLTGDTFGILNNETLHYLVVAEFAFFTYSAGEDTSALDTTYGGTYGTLLNQRGDYNKIRPTESFSYGYYLIREVENGQHHTIKKLKLKAKFPTVNSNGFVIQEELFLEDMDKSDASWTKHDFGTSVLRISGSQINKGTQYWSQMVGTWTFPYENNLYEAFGLPSPMPEQATTGSMSTGAVTTETTGSQTSETSEATGSETSETSDTTGDEDSASHRLIFDAVIGTIVTIGTLFSL